MKHPIICVDFDGVIHSYISGWKGIDVIPDPPVNSAIEWLKQYLPIPDRYIGEPTPHVYIEVLKCANCSGRGFVYTTEDAFLGNMNPDIRQEFTEMCSVCNGKGTVSNIKPKPIVMIYSSRSKSWRGRRAMKKWLIKWGLEPEYITDKILKFPKKKPAAFLTIDDRAICFNGNFPTQDEMLNFKSWNKKDV